MILVDNLKQRLSTRPLEPIESLVRELVLADDAAMVGPSERTFLKLRLAETFGVSVDAVQLWIVGSAKLGYSIVEKRQDDRTVKPRFRPFGAESDIDVAVVCPPLFESLWAELSQYGYKTTPRMPWRYRDLGNYLVHGWLRPDMFPDTPSLITCASWKRLFDSFSIDSRFSRRRVRGGLYYRVQDLLFYHSRGFDDCRRAILESQ